MHTLIFATNNRHKVAEVEQILQNRWQVISLKEAGLDIDIPEPHLTLEENAREKSFTIHRLTGHDCFSEDTGLEVAALGGEPGVHSARYAGEGRDFQANIGKLLDRLRGEKNRRARFRTVISLIWQGKEYQFEGSCEGTIIEKGKGVDGFGYDPVFVPDGDNRTFAEMPLDEKNNYSHRRKAMDELIAFLDRLDNPTKSIINEER
jgi:XTP/dITP diphosphohydrolase